MPYPVRNLVTTGGPNNGISQEANCTGIDADKEPANDARCQIDYFMKKYQVLSPYSGVLQSILAPTNYYRDYKRQSEYLDGALFLPYINNEKDHPKMSQYKKRFESLNSMTMFKYTKDPIIFPRESSWFGQEIAMKDRKVVTEGEK